MNLAAKVISILFHPLFLPLYALPLYFSIESYQNLILNNADINFLSAIYSVMALVGVLFPILSMYVMIRTGLLSDFNAYNRVERKPVFFIVLMRIWVAFLMKIRGKHAWLVQTTTNLKMLWNTGHGDKIKD